MSIDQNIQNIISNMNPTELGKHLHNYGTLYTKPLTVWKKIISNRSDGYNLLILHIIYFSFFVFFIVGKKDTLIVTVFYEITIIIIPLLMFILPFLFFVKIFRLKYNWVKLFRLFLILKLQISPILYTLYILIKFIEIEDFYIVFENIVYVLWIAFIIIFPLIVRINLVKKIIWIVCNYLIFVLEITIFIAFLYQDNGAVKFFNKVKIDTPNNEYLSFKGKEMYPIELFNDSLYLIKFTRLKNAKFTAYRPQFVTNQLDISFKKTALDELRAALKKLNNGKPTKVLPNSRKLESLKIKSLTLSYLDTLKYELDKEFNALYVVSKRLEDSAKFESNRQYFRLLSNYLETYSSAYTDTTQILKVMMSSHKIIEIVHFDKDNFAYMYKINPTEYAKIKQKIMTYERNFEERANKSTFVVSILFFPVAYIGELIFDDNMNLNWL